MTLFKRFAFLLLLAIPINGVAQSVFRAKYVDVDSVSFCVDTLSIIPNSFTLSFNNQPLQKNSFKVDFFTATITIRDSSLFNKRIFIQYQVFDVDLTKPFLHKDRTQIEENRYYAINEFNLPEKSYQNPWMENASDLKKSGSVTRGISIGNRQDVVVNSDLNLQLDGVVFDDFMIKAVISDKNIPIQPEGNTQQLQEFDKVFIQLYNKSTKITAGDFDVVAPPSDFLKANKKVLGAMVDYKLQFADSTYLNTSSSFAITKGKFARINLIVSDGNQGPYRLIPETGDANIVVIGGSERVFLNGVLLKRGIENDYSIDYNLGEIAFTPKIIIAQESKVVVEFEYTDRHYSRSLFTTFNQWSSKKIEVAFNVYSEQDMKNQSIQPELTTSQKNILTNAGNDFSQMISPAFDSVPFNSSQVRYKMMDTIVNGIYYDSVFVYSSNQDSAFYALSFTNVGANNGDYALLNNTTNGRVFVWMAPQNGLHVGMYSPIYVLVPPQKKQMVTGKVRYLITPNSELNIELALSNFNKNSFSTLDKNEDMGGAITSSYKNKILLFPHDSLPKPFLVAIVSHQYKQASFSEIEPARNAEFYRRYNLGNNALQAAMNLLSVDLLFDYLKLGKANYTFNYLDFQSQFKGMQHALNFKLNTKKVETETQGTATSGSGLVSNSNYFKLIQSVKFKSHLGNIGTKYDAEHNLANFIGMDSIALSSLKWDRYEVFMENPDSILVNYKVWYNTKSLSVPFINEITHFSNTSEQGVSLKYNHQSQSVNLNTIYREVLYSAQFANKNDYAVIANLSYQGQFLKGAITTNIYYQTSTGQEQKKEYQYLKVAKGQGTYIWTDFNNNKVEELDEFSIAPFADQGEYVRLWVLTNEYTKVISNEFNQSLILNPSVIITKKSLFASVLSKLKNQTSVFLNNKTTDGPEIGANPFSFIRYDENNIASSRSIRNNFYINQSDPLWNMEYVYNNQYNKLFLTSGFENKSQNSNAIILRSNPLKKITLKIEAGTIYKKSSTELLTNRNYQIASEYIDNTVSYLQSSNLRIALSYKYTEKMASASLFKNNAFFNQANLEFQYNLPKRGVIASKIAFIHIFFDNNENSPLSLEILQGLTNGKNLTYSLSFQTVISKNIQLNSTYELRASSSNSVVQIGNISLRAFF